MKEQFLPYKYAKLLKELGFQERCFAVIDEHGMIYRDDKPINRSEEHITAPLYQQVEQWLWDKHEIWIDLTPTQFAGQKNNFYFGMRAKKGIIGMEIITFGNAYYDYMSAKEEGLKQAIEHLYHCK